MARSKLRKTNSALSRGQMVRTENRFVLSLEEDLYDPDEPGACCTENAEGEKCSCADTNARECCLQKGDFFPGISCSSDPCPCDESGACCIPCPGDPSNLGICVSGVTAGVCTTLGGNFFLGVDCTTNNPCTDDCQEPEPPYQAKIACCRPCPEGTNTARNGTCTVYTGTGFSLNDAIENANAQCIDGFIGNTTTGSIQSPAADPCSANADGLGGFGGCPNCNTKKRPCCQFCDAVTDTDCEFTQSGDCYEVEVDFGGDVVGPGCQGVLTNPSGTLDLNCVDNGGANACSGNASDCFSCQEVCCCQDGVATPTLPENCTGPVIDLEPGQACDNTLFCELPFNCIECDQTTCDCGDLTYTGSGPLGGCSYEVKPKSTCRVVNTNKACPGFERPDDSDVEGEVDCGVFGPGSDPSLNGGCGCGNCSFQALAQCVANDGPGYGCIPTFCDNCFSCRIYINYASDFGNCGGGYDCCLAFLNDPDGCNGQIGPPPPPPPPPTP
jgi:hypothetical protein